MDRVIGPVAAIADIGLDAGKEAFGIFDALDWIENRICWRGEVRRKAVDLLAVKNRVAFEERNLAFGLFAVVVRLRAMDAVGKNDRTAFLAFANLRAEFLRLLVGHPNGTGEVVRHGFHPQHHDVDAAIRLPVVAQGPRDAPGGVFGVPGLEPGADAFFEFLDEARRDARVKIGFFRRHDVFLSVVKPPDAASMRLERRTGPRARRDALREGNHPNTVHLRKH